MSGTSKAWVGVGVVAVLAVGWVSWAWTRPPQMGADEATFKAVDALFTAVTARDERLVRECEQRLLAAKDAGRLAPAAWDYLDGVIRRARASRWESAAERLYTFMLAQRRDGSVGHAKSENHRRLISRR